MTSEIKNLYQQETLETVWCPSLTLQISKQTEAHFSRGGEVHDRLHFSCRV